MLQYTGLLGGQIIRRNDSLDKAQVETPAPYSAFFVLLEVCMDILNDRVKPLYFKYLVAASGSAMVASIFGMIDAMMVGKYHGPSGNAAIAIFTPVWSFVYSLGIL